MKRYSEYTFGDMMLIYSLDEQQRMSLMLIPEKLKGRMLTKEYQPEPIVQIHAQGDRFPNGYGNGHTMACTSATDATVKTDSGKDCGRTCRVRFAFSDGFGKQFRISVSRIALPAVTAWSRP